MRVGVDARSLRGSRTARGVAVYTSTLLSELARAYPGDAYEALVPGRRKAAAPAGIHRRSTLVGGRALFAAAGLTGRPRLDRLVGGCDVLWATAPAPLALSSDVPLVVTVHDLSFEHRPRDYGAYERAWHRLARPRALARRAARVIAVSATVRDQLIGEWQLEPERVVVVRSGPGRAPGPPGPLPPGLPREYVLAVGALEPRKRPELLVEAYARARGRGLRAGLVLAGEGRLRRRLERAGATALGFVGDDTLDALYAHASAVVCVSREEGFGFTPLEALARGTPALVADLPVFAETLGEAALRVPPADAEELSAALLRLERDLPLRERLATAGAELVKRFSWQRAARETHAVLQAAGSG
jgi:glycosyltransferase involved in cell wall biosynthesis